ncbi:aspartate/methionine/tyrosine aminotransferase [Lewinella marina]|uniref:Aminotransferase n=1 Tax=Neolewinella marina TaxID=438751 RepID=A0A2G0CJZ3_9BACT|nr:aminotransferase class I/II-fold pyridoxal phosphate-dependent enzyme [Neolewinella marina]NJB84533.1 aspartate/methionine/tyrosine aminotransferase [Neolewinella marina]PHL00282.1 1-aminocyclopropane-1-carboxylate synthase [Neolewinella marina]
MLSQRGRRKADEPLRPDLDFLSQASENPYAPDNTTGAIALCIAENLLQWDAMRDKLQAIARDQPWPEWMAAYTQLGGAPDFREAVAGFVSRHIAGQPLAADHFCGSAGATAVVEVSAMCLGDAGDYAVFPAPAYQAYLPDIQNKAGLLRHDITHYARPFGPEEHPLSLRELDTARETLGTRFRMLVLTQPDNPTGAIYGEAQLREIAEWCIRHQIHLIVNEIYALSRFDRQTAGLEHTAPFVSFLPYLEQRDSPYLHWWYSFSKDFGISGFRVGLLYSRNETFRQAYGNYNAPHQISNPTQWLLARLLEDDAWVTAFQERNARLLTAAYRTVTDALDELKVPYTPARGSLFVWADFSGYLPERNREAAEALWAAIFTETGVLLTAPGGLGQPEAGWFRIVYSGVSTAALAEAMRRLSQFLNVRRGSAT